jgi:hypothetical protein
MGAPKAPPPQQDPMLDQLMATAQRQQAVAMQGEAAGDTASLMARYGMRLALGGGGVGAGGGGLKIGGFSMPAGGAGMFGR